MVDEFLPPQHRISTARHSGQYDTALEQTDECAEENNEGHTFPKEVKDSFSQNDVFGREAKRGCIELGPQKRGEGKSRPAEEFSSDNEDSIKEDNEKHELCEEKVEQGEYMELYAWNHGDEDPSIDVKDNILADTDEAGSPLGGQTLLSEECSSDYVKRRLESWRRRSQY